MYTLHSVITGERKALTRSLAGTADWCSVRIVAVTSASKRGGLLKPLPFATRVTVTAGLREVIVRAEADDFLAGTLGEGAVVGAAQVANIESPPPPSTSSSPATMTSLPGPPLS